MRFLYTFFLIIWAILLSPWVLWKKSRKALLAKLGLGQPKTKPKGKGEIRVWIHAVSLGETKAARPLIEQIKKDWPQAKIYFSTGTETGLNEAKRNDLLDSYFFLPLDLPWVMKKLVRSISPDLFILIETDFWLNLLLELRSHGSKIALVNGKISTKSAGRHKRFRPFAHKLLGGIDCFCLQSEEYRKLFVEIGVNEKKITVTGNVKFDTMPATKKTETLHFPKGKKIVTIASTHESEEELILNALEGIGEEVCLFLAPRHPERFEKVAKILQGRKVPFRRIDEPSDGKEQIVLINKIGVMDPCFENSHAAIVGGSFINYIGGHNIYEPARYGLPVFYGPHMHKQRELVLAFERHKVSGKVSLENLKTALQSALAGKFDPQGYKNLKAEMEGATSRSWKLIKML